MAQIPENINRTVREYISDLNKEIPVQKARKYIKLDIQPIPFTYRDYLERDGFAAEVLKEGIEIV